MKLALVTSASLMFCSVVAAEANDTDSLCFRVAVGECRLEDNVVDPESWWIPPSRIRLDPNPPTPDEQEANWVRGVEQAARPHDQEANHWMFSVGGWSKEPNDRVTVHWSGGYTVVELTFDVPRFQNGSRLTVFSDAMGEPTPVCNVQIEPLPCK